MIGIDTNVLVRYVVRDDEEQYAAAAATLEALTRDYPTETCLTVVRRLIATASLEFDDGEGAVRALSLAQEGADFADALIQGAMEHFGVKDTVTFDRAAAQRLGWRVLN